MIKSRLVMLTLLGLSSYTLAFENEDDSTIDTQFEQPKSTVIERMQQLGYDPEPGGVCYGLAAMGAQAVLRMDGEGYYDRIQKIKLSDYVEDEQYFYDGVSIYMNSNLPEGFEISREQNLEAPAALFKSVNDTKNVVPHVAHKFLASFDKNLMTIFLNNTQKSNEQTPFSLLITYDGHTVQIGFDGKSWLSINHDNTIYKSNIEDVILNVLPEEFLYDDLWIASIEVLSSGKSINIQKEIIEHSSSLDFIQENKTQNIISINLAFREGYNDVITNFTQQILKSNIELSNKVDLLASKNHDGTSGLYFAFQNNNTDIIANFTQHILESPIIELPDKIKLLIAPHPDGLPGLYTGKKEAVTVFTKHVLESNIEDSDKVELLVNELEVLDHSCFYLSNKQFLIAYMQQVLESGQPHELILC